MEKEKLEEEYKIIDDIEPNQNVLRDDDEYKILEDEEDIKRKQVIGVVEEIIESIKDIQEEEKKEQAHGKLLAIVGDMQFLKDPIGNNALCFSEPTEDYCFTGRVKHSVSYAKVNGILDKEFLYEGFQASMMVLFLKNHATEQTVDLKELYNFLKTDIERGTNYEPNIDLLFRKNQKTNKIDVYMDIRCGEDKIKEEVPFKDVNRVCKEINTANKNYEKRKDKSFGEK